MTSTAAATSWIWSRRWHASADMENVLLGLDFILFAQTIALMKSLSLGITPDNPCPTGEVNRVVKGVTLYPYTLK